LRAMSHNS